MTNENENENENAETPGSVVAGKIVAQGFAAGLGLIAGGPLGAIVGASVSPILELIIEKGNRRSAENVYATITGIADVAGVTVEELARDIEQRDDVLALVTAALAAAMSTNFERKVKALARAVGDGLRDSTRLDTSQLVVAALANLEIPHVLTLRVVSNQSSSNPHLLGPESSKHFRACGMVELTRRFPNYGAGLVPIIATLEREAIIARVEMSDDIAEIPGVKRGDSRAWRPTQFGRLCLEYLDGQS